MIKLEKINFNYDIEMQFDISIPAQQIVSVSGVSGSGKSSLLNLIAGFIYPESMNGQIGKVILNDKDCTHIPPHQRPVSMLFQENNVFNHLTVAQNIGLGLQPHLKFDESQKQQINTVANQVNLEAYLQRKPYQLSGGQKQRVALARCLIRAHPILLLDEPFSALDKSLRLEMSALLSSVCNQKKLTVIMVTHQVEEVAGLSDRHLVINAGRIIEDSVQNNSEQTKAT